MLPLKGHARRTSGPPSPPLAQPNVMTVKPSVKCPRVTVEAKDAEPFIPKELAERKGPFVFQLDEVNWDQETMFEAARTDAQQKKDYDKLFGPDQTGGEWEPVDDLPETFKLTGNYPPKDYPYDFHLTLRAKIYWHILTCIKDLVLDGKKRMITNLYHLGRYPEGMEKAAVFRQEAIIPIFGSVKGFYEFLVKFREDVNVILYMFPKEQPAMTIDEVLDFFRIADDEEAVKLTQFHKFFLRSNVNFLEFLDEIIFMHMASRRERSWGSPY